MYRCCNESPARGLITYIRLLTLFQMTTENRLLSVLPREVYEKLAPNLKRVSLEQGKILHHPGEAIEDLYFPIDCLISITITMTDGSTVEAGLVGNREVVGVNAFMGGRETTQTEYIVQMAGSAIKVDAGVLLEEFDRNKGLRDVLLRYTQALIAQISQTTGCNSLHVLDQRLARWLLEAQDRIDSDDLKLTQEFLGHMLGVRRAGVTQAAQKLQERDLIRYNRGRVQILDQAGLEATACECFQVLREEYDRLLGAKDRDG
ncbi:MULTISPECIES: Crp/Fnr family transcriptional regulator [unclassified Coleofasciculus]|uniref:Crp/Fnr family transcriptional regulator n=1 Tax=Cyanophyceae TaxID=3028117 RepID=UPI0018EF8D62|nr:MULTISPECIES: Crp/Fnr family transcriptional regulator [unclassified Coleofasciculus]